MPRQRRRPTVTDVTPARSVLVWLRARPLVEDSLLALAVFGFAVLLLPPRGQEDLPTMTTGTFVLVGLSSAALILRRRLPIPVWVVATFAGVVGIVLVSGPSQAVIPAFVALYSVAARTDRRTAVLTGLATAVSLAGALIMTVSEGWADPTTYAVVAWSGMAAAIGDSVRSRRAVLAAAEERARRAEHSREEEAQRRVTEERLRIARELHDVVAHHIAVINVQAGVAGHLAETQPAEARAALAHVRRSSQLVLDELATILGLLRTTEEPASTAPAPGLAQVDDLIDSMRHAGMHVTSRVSGMPRDLPTGTDLAAYRIVQESLTNAGKHGTGRVELSIQYLPDVVRIDVTNPMRSNGVPSSSSEGHGIIGMRERVLAAGGQLESGPLPNGTFAVRVNLPGGEQ